MSGGLRSWRRAILTVAVVVIAACGRAEPTNDAMNDTNATDPGDTGSTAHVTAPTTPITITYGDAPEQFGILHLPRNDRADGPVPVVVLVHGGFWRNPFDLTRLDPLAADLVARGVAAWNIEYRRLGDEGGGWPGTLTDVAAAVDALAPIAAEHPIDLARVAVVGHSAGGHLALWAAGRPGLPDGAPGASPVVVPTVAIGLGAVVDLVGAAVAQLGNGAVPEFLAGTPEAVPDRYETARPRLDAGPRMVSVVGTNDDIVPPPFSIDPNVPDAVEVVEVDGADHFDLIDPAHAAWAAAIEALGDIADRPSRTERDGVPGDGS